MKKNIWNFVIAFVCVVAALVAIAACAKLFPFWSTVICIVTAVAAFIGGWFCKQWWDEHVNLKEE